jgi:predicted PurR-regulated permease PerM
MIGVARRVMVLEANNVRPGGDALPTMTPERVVDLRARTIFRVLAIAIAVAVMLEVVWIARHVIAWILIAVFLTLALDPLVGVIQRRARLGRGGAIALTYLVLILVIVAIGATFVPKLVDETNGFVQASPNYVHDLTHGRGRLGFLETRYHVVEKVRAQVKQGGATKVLGLSGAALSATKSVITVIAATVTIVFLTFFMLLEGGEWVERCYSLFPEESRPRWRRVGHDIYKTVGGYVTGNILISLIAGASITIVLLVLGVPYAVALGLVVAFLDLIPLAGATVAGVIVTVVAFLHTIPAGIIVLVFFIVYQQLENHWLQPVIYGRTVQLSPLVVLVSVLVGAALAGIIGALAAIPVAGAIQVLVRDQLSARRSAAAVPAAPPG